MADTALTPEQVRSLLRECVTVVAPGEILVLRLSPDDNFTPNQIREYQQSLNWWLEEYAPGIQVLVVVGRDGQIVRQNDPLPERVRAMATKQQPGTRHG